MYSRRANKILLILLLFCFACQAGKAGFRVIVQPLPVEEPAINESSNIPNSEFEGSHIVLGSVAHVVIQKNAPSSCLVSALNFAHPVFLERMQIKRSSLLIRHYLSHIYPSHNFW